MVEMSRVVTNGNPRQCRALSVRIVRFPHPLSYLPLLQLPHQFQLPRVFEIPSISTLVGFCREHDPIVTSILSIPVLLAGSYKWYAYHVLQTDCGDIVLNLSVIRSKLMQTSHLNPIIIDPPLPYIYLMLMILCFRQPFWISLQLWHRCNTPSNRNLTVFTNPRISLTFVLANTRWFSFSKLCFTD